MKKILHGEKKSTLIKNIQVDGKLCTNNKMIVNAFNMFFYISCHAQDNLWILVAMQESLLML